MDATIRSLPIGSTTRTLSGVIAALLDPVLIVVTLAVSTRLHGGVYDGPELLLSLLVFALTFPSPVRRFTRLRQLITDVFYTWSTACFVLLFFGYAGRFFVNFEPGTLEAWALAVPPVLVLGHLAFDRVVRSITAERGRKAIVVGVNPLARSLVSRMDRASHLGLRFEGFFDDRGPARLEGGAQTPVVGRLEELPAYVLAHGIEVIYITLPMSSHPRILALLHGLRESIHEAAVAVDQFHAAIGLELGCPALLVFAAVDHQLFGLCGGAAMRHGRALASHRKLIALTLALREQRHHGLQRVHGSAP